MSITVAIIIILACSAALLGFLLYLSNSKINRLKTKIDLQAVRIFQQQQNIKDLKDHSKTVEAIKNDRLDLIKKTQGAKSENEVLDIFSDLFKYNNSRVQDD